MSVIFMYRDVFIWKIAYIFQSNYDNLTEMFGSNVMTRGFNYDNLTEMFGSNIMTRGFNYDNLTEMFGSNIMTRGFNFV